MFNKNIIIPINKDYNLSINHIGSKPEFAIICKASKSLIDLKLFDYDDRGFVPCENQVKEFSNFEELINFVAHELDYLNIPHRVMNKEYE